MSNRFGLLSVKNAELLAGLSRLVQRGNELTAEVLAHLAELEERRLHLQLGFPSLFAYCVEALGLSEGSAGRRVAAARVCRRYPEAFDLVARGDLHLSALCGLAPHLGSQNATELLAACCHKTRRQVDELLAARFPKPDVRGQIRRLPSCAALQAPLIADESDMTHRIETHDDAVVGASATGDAAEATPAGVAERSGNHGSATAPPVVGSPPARRCEIEALSADRFGVHFTADAELKELLERARALASHRLPKNDLSSLMRVVLASFVKHEEARRFAIGRKPRRARPDPEHAKAPSMPATPPGGVGVAVASAEGKTSLVVSQAFTKRSKRSRHVPAAVRRAVYERDGGQCSFVSEDGRRCDSRTQLELDHIEPWARLGHAEVDDIRLRCRAHNQLHALECFGARHIEAKIAARREVASLVSNPPGSAHPSAAASL